MDGCMSPGVTRAVFEQRAEPEAGSGYCGKFVTLLYWSVLQAVEPNRPLSMKSKRFRVG
jgi:hypothetical protein